MVEMNDILFAEAVCMCFCCIGICMYTSMKFHGKHQTMIKAKDLFILANESFKVPLTLDVMLKSLNIYKFILMNSFSSDDKLTTNDQVKVLMGWWTWIQIVFKATVSKAFINEEMKGGKGEICAVVSGWFGFYA